MSEAKIGMQMPADSMAEKGMTREQISDRQSRLRKMRERIAGESDK